MRKLCLIPFVALALLSAANVSAQDKDKNKSDERSYLEGEFKGDYHCWRAWRKDEKIRYKLMQADEMEAERPWAADRKRRAAYRKAWKRDMREYEHRNADYDHDWWDLGWKWHRAFWY